MTQWPIHELIPHSGDMILLDELLEYSDEHVVTILTVRPGLLSAADGSLPAWTGIELMAQTVAAYAGCQARLEQAPIRLGFLLGTRRYQCNVERFPAGATLRILARNSLQDDNGMGVFECRLEGPGILAEARLSVFAPRDTSAYLQETTND